MRWWLVTALLVAICLALHTLSGCAGVYPAEQAISASERSVSAALDSFKAVDHSIEQSIVSAAKDEASGLASLAVYQAKRAKLVLALNALLVLDMTGRTTVAMVKSGQSPMAALQSFQSDLLLDGLAVLAQIKAIAAGVQ
jgi:hypothetical protein